MYTRWLRPEGHKRLARQREVTGYLAVQRSIPIHAPPTPYRDTARSTVM